MPAMRASKLVMLCRWPGKSTKRIRLPSASTITAIFVVRPPRDLMAGARHRDLDRPEGPSQQPRPAPVAVPRNAYVALRQFCMVSVKKEKINVRASVALYSLKEIRLFSTDGDHRQAVGALKKTLAPLARDFWKPIRPHSSPAWPFTGRLATAGIRISMTAIDFKGAAEFGENGGRPDGYGHGATWATQRASPTFPLCP